MMCESESNKLSSITGLDNSKKFLNKTLQDYEVISVIGNGAFGTCFKVRDKATSELYAWKGIDYEELSESKKESLVSEISVLSQLQHPNIVQYYHHLVNYEAKSIFIVMECCEGGDLAQLITKARTECKRFEEKYIWRVLFQICKALQVCHNKIKQGTILHRDIKPANIFLDAEGNAKLGDFGLARMLRRNENFAKTFVGTPYYMSPELIKGSKYDRKSDVWAVGCLIYEMCALRTAFRGQEFSQLSTNITNGNFKDIPAIYSTDLREIIAFMLKVDNTERPSIEIIIRHPIVVRNISDLGNEFPKLIEIEQDCYAVVNGEARCKLQFSPLADLSSTLFSEQNSFNEGYGQRRLSLTGAFTPDLREELFYSARRRILTKSNIIQQSDPELYESIRRDDYATIDDTIKITAATTAITQKPTTLTENVFDKILQDRLHAIRAQESLLKQKELSLDEREQRLNEREKKLQQMEQDLQQRLNHAETKTPILLTTAPTKKQIPAINNSTERSRMPLPTECTSITKSIFVDPTPPPVPPRKSSKHDDTYCTIEPNDTILQEPTVAKINLANLPVAKSFSTLRRVTFQSPKKFIKYDIENATGKSATNTKPNQLKKTQQQQTQGTQMQSSVSSKGSEDSGESNGTQRQRKSILSIFGINRANKVQAKPAAPAQIPTPIKSSPLKENAEVLSQCKTSDLTNIWTKENTRAAFELWAAMNRENGQSIASAPRHKLRQSVRERSTLQRSRLRRSMIVSSGTVGMPTREQILV
ncbi:serine/threonine-protein kinase Nek10 [Teleopsis dalmanni]|uniref:serine/threonine-protein kinase Nek10 n=1 Tax=Teleopsis dalmanni TaxID=139649 RepID=UPI0018CE72D2|nr:serine/threonine-protein kinase Nek10 [Teleopsis dalmanni]